MEQNRDLTLKRPLFLTVLLAFVLALASLAMQKPPVVQASAASPSINITNLVMNRGQTRQLRISGTKSKITWKSSKPAVVRVNTNGKLTARKAGTAVITGRVNRKNYTCRVRVSKSGQKALVAYFSQTGTTKDVAEKIRSLTGADTLRIKAKNAYPDSYDRTVSRAKRELDRNARPKITSVAANMSSYDVIYIGYPIWWGDMPMILYSFFDEYDFSGKTIIPFNTHGGSGFSNTISTIAGLEPNASVNREGFTVSRNTVQDAEPDIINWLTGLGYRK